MRFLIPFAILCLCAPLVPAQTIHNSTSIGTPTYYSPSKKQLKPLGDEHFMMMVYTSEMNNYLVVYDIDLNVIYSLPIENTGYYADFEYIPSLHGLVVISKKSNEEKKDKERFEISASIYDATDGKLVKSEVLINDAKNIYSIKFSDNFEYFIAGPMNDPGDYGMFQSGDLSLLYTFAQAEDTRSQPGTRMAGNNGKSVFFYMKRDRSLIFNIYYPDSSKNKSVNLERVLGGGREYAHISLKQLNKSTAKLVTSRDFKSVMEYVDVYDIDLAEGNVTHQYTVAIDKDFIRNGLYSNTYEVIHPTKPLTLEMAQSVEKKGPKKLKNTKVQHSIFDDEGNLYLVCERLDFKSGPRSSRRQNQIINAYIGKDVKLMSFDPEGKFRWGSVYERSARTASQYTQTAWDTPPAHPFHGRWSGVETFAEIKGNGLHLINYEATLMGAYGTFYRRFSTKNGELEYLKPLPPEEKQTINVNFISMVGPDKVAIVTKKGADYNISQEEKIRLYSISLPE